MTLTQARQEILKELKRLSIPLELMKIRITNEQEYYCGNTHSTDFYSISVSTMISTKKNGYKRFTVNAIESLEHAVEVMKVKLKYNGKELLPADDNSTNEE